LNDLTEDSISSVAKLLKIQKAMKKKINSFQNQHGFPSNLYVFIFYHP